MQSILDKIDNLEQSLKRHLHWQAQKPAAQLLESSLPFSADTLSPLQWLQFIFIPQIKTMLLSHTYPESMQIAPYFEQCLPLNVNGRAEILTLIASIDGAVRGHHGQL